MNSYMYEHIYQCKTNQKIVGSMSYIYGSVFASKLLEKMVDGWVAGLVYTSMR